MTDTLVTDEFVEFLMLQTHIPGLVADPMLNGGGAHEIRTGGFLFTHIDFTSHPADYGDPGFLGTGRRLQRRLNVILYLNKDWKAEYGGYLELWSSKRVGYLQYEKGTEHVEYAPIFNRMVIFPTNARSFHGHPYPLNTPPGVTRKSIAAYYYTDGRPEEDEYESHSTVFMETR